MEIVKLELHSTSEEPFFNITVWITDARGNDRAATSLGQLEPRGRQRHVVYFERGTLPASPLQVRLEFQDASGRTWHRVGNGPVKQRRHLTHVSNVGTSADHVMVPLKPKPDFYSAGMRAIGVMPADEAPGLPGTATPELHSDPTAVSSGQGGAS